MPWFQLLRRELTLSQPKPGQAGRDLLRSPGPTCCSSRVHGSKLPRIVSRWVLGISTDGDSTASLGSPHNKKKSAFLCSDGISCVSVCTHCLLSCHQDQQDILLIAPAIKQELSHISIQKCTDLLTFIRSFSVYAKLVLRAPFNTKSPLGTIIRQFLKRRTTSGPNKVVLLKPVYLTKEQILKRETETDAGNIDKIS